MDLKTQIHSDMKDAMKAQLPIKVSALRMLMADIKKREIDKRSPLDESEIHKAIQSMLKQRADSVEQFTKGARQDLADREKAEIDILSVYLPRQLSHGEVEALVVSAISETGSTRAADIGKVMKAVLTKASGRADGKLVNEIARAKLGSG